MSGKPMTGPLKIKHFPGGKYEAECWFEDCRWSWFDFDLEKAERLLLWHIDCHVNPPEQYVLKYEDMPGR